MRMRTGLRSFEGLLCTWRWTSGCHNMPTCSFSERCVLRLLSPRIAVFFKVL